MNKYMLVALGGALGSVARLGLMHFLPAILFNLPAQILLINGIGCFFVGCCAEVLEVFYASYNTRLFLITGFFGGFTTFSAFALDYKLLVERDLISQAIIYVVLSVVVSLVAFFVGMKLMKYIFSYT